MMDSSLQPGLVLLVLMVLAAFGTGRAKEMDNAIQEPPPGSDRALDSSGPGLNTESTQEEWAILARENVMRMRSDSVRCSAPRPRVVRVQHVHPQAHKRFVPSCVELHRCDRNSGCCDDAGAECVMVRKQRIALHFYVVTLQGMDGASHGNVDRLHFVNHTQCGCRKRRRKPKRPLVGHSVSPATAASVPWWPIVAGSAVWIMLLRNWGA